MAHKKAAGSTKNGRDSGPQYLGVKINHGQAISVGEIIVRQRGTAIMPGQNVSVGRDHTLFAQKAGKVEFKNKRKSNYDGTWTVRKVANVI